MMYNCPALNEPIQQPHLCKTLDKTPVQGSIMNSTNKFVYIKKTCTSLSTELEPVKVLINPNFNKKVFVNPNFNSNRNITSTAPPKIHVNPNATNLRLGNINEYKNVKKIHVNPNVLKNVPFSNRSSVMRESENKNISNEKEMNRTVILTKTKLIRIKAKNATESKIRKRRLSVKSQFKVIKSSLLNKSDQSETEIKLKQKLLKPADKYINGPEIAKPLINKFKVDNRTTKLPSPKGKKYIYVNRFLSISDIAKNNLLKKNKNKLCVVNIGGILYKKSPNVLKKTSNSYPKLNNVKKTRENITSKSRYNFVRNSVNTSKPSNKLVKPPAVSKFGTTDIKNISQRRVCNIPCPYYRKFGRCKGKENGKCYRKHDPDQIALCTKFLQGACIDKKCLLSHNVSPEKMPTCKFYLEGSCSRDDCPYLHVRISPKAEVCKDFLEGFCRKAAECDKRHQFLCPDYEKNGSCLKQRCQYPHGKMVRKYSVFNKNKFAKKSSCDDGTTNVKIDCNAKGRNPKSNTVNIAENCEGNIKSRYYIGQNNLETEDGDRTPHTHQSDCIDQENDQSCGIKSRPKLGKLSSFIAFESS